MPPYGGQDQPDILSSGGPMGGFKTMGPGQLGEGMIRAQSLANPHVTKLKLCMLHNKPLRYYCDNYEELICYDCTVMGPHNTQLHRICNVEEAFRYRFEKVNK